MLTPYQRDVYGDIFTPERIRHFAYRFMCAGINAGAVAGVGNDVEHDNVDATGRYFVVESYIAKANDPHFTEGSWVLASWIPDDELWEKVLAGDINGYSYEAMTFSHAVVLEGDFDTYAVGETEPDPIDG
ncbi:MAG: XkdF-like putative serine protease domain-containing protein, partial [Shewanella sp.]|nr:XkdF-like putative serine protease domain-containing protein [Shewanella sp.]